MARTAAVVAFGLIVFCAVPLPPRHAPQAVAPAVHGEGPLRAGAAQVQIALSLHPVLAGYAGSHRAVRVSSPVYARALVLEAGNARATLAVIDTLLIPPGLSLRDCGLLAATHTHTGPGGLWDSFAAGFVGAGAFDASQRQAVQSALDEAVRRAAQSMQPAQVVAARADWTDGPSRARSDGPLDRGMFALRVQGPSGPIATVIDYAMHPTSASRDALSSDWPGVTAAQFQEPTFVLEGALGNATFDRALDTERLGVEVAREAKLLLDSAKPSEPRVLDCSERAVELPHPVGSSRVPWPLRRGVGNLLGLFFAPSAVETRLSFAGVTLWGIPAEPVGELGLRARPFVVVSLANGYAGYVETEARWQEGKGEAARTDFGPDLARALGF
jgi:neutral ceramidase